MRVRPLATADLPMLIEIDGAIESERYLHLAREVPEHDAATEMLQITWKLEERDLREPLNEPNRLDDETSELAFAYRQVVGGIEDGIALCMEDDDLPIATLLAAHRPERGVIELLDLRVDYDQRREGFAQAMLFELLTKLRESEGDDKPRAVLAAVPAGNVPMHRLLQRCGFELSGFDEKRQSNFDLVKEQATMLWYLETE